MKQSRRRAKPNRKKLTKTVVDAAKPAEKWDHMVWDTEIKGFGLQVKPSGHKAYVIQYRNKSDRVRRYIIGTHGNLTPDEARSQAKIRAGEVVSGKDILEEEQKKRRAGTVAELADSFLKDYVEDELKGKKPRTQKEYRRLIKSYIVPILGRRKAEDVARADVSRIHKSLSSTPYQANRVLAVMSKMMNWAEKEGIRPDHSNPCRHVEKYPETAHKGRLTPEHLTRLGEALVDLEEQGPVRLGRGKKPIERTAAYVRFDREAAAAIRLLLFTGCRFNEILSLRWDDVDLDNQMLTLHDTKTGPRTVLLTAPAMEVLSNLKRTDGPYLFSGKGPNSARNDALARPWEWVRERAGLGNVRLHTLRHTFGSVGGDADMSVLMVAKLLGHKQAITAERYIKPDEDPMRRAAERVAGDIAASLNGQSGEVVPFEKG